MYEVTSYKYEIAPRERQKEVCPSNRKTHQRKSRTDLRGRQPALALSKKRVPNNWKYALSITINLRRECQNTFLSRVQDKVDPTLGKISKAA